MQRKRTASLLSRNPIFRNFIGATTISLLGSNIFDLAMPLYIWERTHSAMALSYVNIGLNLPYFLMAPVTGYSVDHFDKRRVMMCSDVGQVLCMLFLLFYDLTGQDSIWPIVATVFTAKTLMITFETVTTFQLIPALVKPQDLSQANTWFLSSLRFVQVVGPLTGGVLMSALGVRSCILANVLSFGATLYFVFHMKNLSKLIDGEDNTARRRHRHSAANVLKNFTESLKVIRNSAVFRPFIVLMFLWNLSPLIPNTPSLTYYFTGAKHFTSAEYGSVVSLIGIFGIIGYLIASLTYDRIDFYRAFVGSSVWQASLATLALCFVRHPIALAVVFAMSRTGSAILNMGTFLIRQTRVPKSKMGGVNACLRMFFMSAAPVSALMQGYLIDKFGVGVSLAMGAMCLWGVAYFARAVGSVYDPRGAQVPAQDPKAA